MATQHNYLALFLFMRAYYFFGFFDTSPVTISSKTPRPPMLYTRPFTLVLLGLAILALGLRPVSFAIFAFLPATLRLAARLVPAPTGGAAAVSGLFNSYVIGEVAANSG